MNLKQQQRTMLLVIALLLFIPVGLLQNAIDPQKPQFQPGKANVGKGGLTPLPIEFALGGLVGFREAIAGLLWVRTDEFFHSGDYDAITPMIRIITWLDPHFIDVYETGAWHMDYNFTDEQQRSDRRYVPLSLALMREGIHNNDNMPELYADLAFTHYFRKIGDYPMAADWFRQGQAVAEQERAATEGKTDGDDKDRAKAAAQSVTTLSHMLAHTYEALGMIPQAMQQWQYCIDMHQYNIAHQADEHSPETFGLKSAQKGLFEDERRLKWRTRDTKVAVDFRFRPILKRIAPYEFALQGTMNTIGLTRKTVGFLEDGQAQWGPVDGARVEIRLNDEGYKMPEITSFSLSSLNLNPDTTIMQESASVLKGKIGGDVGKKIDMSQDRKTMYSFRAPRYTVTVWFDPSDPSDCPINVQDRIGWLGQGLTDSDPSVIDTSGVVPGDTSGRPIPGLKILKKTFTLTRADIDGTSAKSEWP